MLQTIRPRHIDPAMDRGNPGGTGKWPDNTGRAKNGDATFDPKPWIPGFLRDHRTVRHRNLDINMLRPMQSFG